MEYWQKGWQTNTQRKYRKVYLRIMTLATYFKSVHTNVKHARTWTPTDHYFRFEMLKSQITWTWLKARNASVNWVITGSDKWPVTYLAPNRCLTQCWNIVHRMLVKVPVSHTTIMLHENTIETASAKLRPFFFRVTICSWQNFTCYVGEFTALIHKHIMMTSSNGNISHVTGPLCEEFTDKQRVLMHGHQGWNVRHGLCHIYMTYVYIYELFIAFVCFVVCSLL